MTKKYREGESKEQRKLRKRKAKLLLEEVQQVPSTVVVASPILPKIATEASRYVCCLKYGHKYSAEYVNKLYYMTKRNLTLSHEFVCFTENSTGIDPDIRIEPLPNLPVQGWWYKPMFFNPKLGLSGTLLFLDLDLIIFNNIDKLFTYKPGEFCIIRDFNRYLVKDYKKFNSSVFRLETGQHPQVYKEFVTNSGTITKKYHGDQDWIYASIKSNYSFWPDEWIQSYKWEMRKKPKMIRGQSGKRNFETPGEPIILPETSIAVFHGDPNPHDCVDPWCAKNWY